MTIVPATEEAIERAAELLRAGELVAFPTETVYGLGADATNDRAVARIFEVKRRPRFNPLIVHVPSLAQAEALAVFDARARAAAEHLWPGPMTLVLPRRHDNGVSLLACAGLDTIAVRVPAHFAAQGLLRLAALPLAAPSANRSGRISPTAAEHVFAEFCGRHPYSRSTLSRIAGQDASGPRLEEGAALCMILDGGPCTVGVESTVLDLTGPVPSLLRLGGVTVEQLSELLGPVRRPSEDPDAPRSPGQLPSHYAPRLPVRLDATSARPGEALLAFGPDAPPGFAAVLYLSRAGEVAEAAANLFAMLRGLDRPEFAGIAVMPIPEEGLGRAINDRLRRAAAPRPPGS